MKITKVTVIRANRGVYCKIMTDEGITGLGESGAWGFQEASAAAIKTFGEYLTGKTLWKQSITGNICIAFRIFEAQRLWEL